MIRGPVVPTKTVRALSARMRWLVAKEDARPVDVVIDHLAELNPDDVPGLLVSLLEHTRWNGGRPPLEFAMTKADQLKAHRQHNAGMTDEWTRRGEREYQRANARARRARRKAS